MACFHLSRRNCIFLLTAIVAVCAKPTPAQPPPGYTLLYEDNFDGNHVNERDWSFRVDRRQVGTWVNGLDRAENVSEHDGALHIMLRKEVIDGKSEYTGGGLISKHQFGYGYYECLSKPFMAGKGAHTAFWQAGGANPNNSIFEIDSYEIDSGTYMGTNNLYLHLFPPSGKEEAWPLRSSEPTVFRPDGWYLDAFEYTPDGIIFYDNGKISAHAEWRDLAAQQVVWLTALNGIRGLDESKQPGESLFKYFRYYAKDYPGVNILPNGDFEYNQQAGPSIQPIAWDQRGSADASFVSTDGAPHGAYFLRQGSNAPYEVANSQSLEYIMNGSYILTAMARSSGGQRYARIRVSGFGGRDLVVPINAGARWKPISIPLIDVKNHSATVTVESAGAPDQWIEVDDIRFMKPPSPGHQPRDPLPFTFRGDPIWMAGQTWPINFPGDDSFIMLANNVGEGEDVSITFEITPKELEDAVPLERAPKTGNAGWRFQLTRGGDIIFRIGSMATYVDLIAQRAYKPGVRTRVTGLVDKGTASLYIDGKLATTRMNISACTNGNPAIGKIGYSGTEYAAVGEITLKGGSTTQIKNPLQHFSGTLSDIRIYNRMLNPQEMPK